MTELNRIVTELVIDARGSVAGAAQHVRASKEAELATNKLSDAEERAYAARKKQEGAYLGVSTSLAKVRAEYTNLQAKMDPVFAAQVRQQKELEKAILVTDAAVRRGVTTEQQAAATISRLRQQQIRDLQAVKDATQDVIRVQRAANSNVPGGMNTANIAAQFQDIGVTAAMGMSPLQIALQQGTQLQAVMGPMGAAGAVKALGAAFLSLVNPVSLITLGLVAGTAALIQYFTTGEEETGELDAVLQQHADSIRALKDAYGDAADGAREYLGETASMAKALTLIAQLKLGDTFRDQVDALVEGGQIFRAESSQVKAEIERVEQAMVGKFGDEYARLNQAREALLDQLANAGKDGLAATKQFEPFKEEIADLVATIQAGSPDIIAFREAIGARINADPTNQSLAKLADELLRLIDGAYKSQSALGASETALEEIRVGADATANSIAGLTAAVGTFNAALATMTGIAAPALSDAEQAAIALNKALAAAGSDFILRQKALDTYAETMARIRNKIAGEAVPIPTPRPNDIEMWDEAGDAIDKAAAKVEQAKSRAAGLVEKFFPGEAARREAEELIALLDRFGDKLDGFQRAAVEARVDELFLAAALGVRDLGKETDKTSDKFGRLKDRGKEAAEALKDGFAGFLEDLFTGRDVLESLISLGSRLASMNFDNVAEGLSNWMGGRGFTLDAPSAKTNIPAARAMGQEIGKAIVPAIAGVTEGPVWERKGRGGAPGMPVEVSLAPASASKVQQAGNAFLDLVASRESRGDYNATLADGRLTGGSRNLISMSLDQIDALQTSMLRHTANTWNSSALGRYQIVQQTLRGLRNEFNLSGDTLFTPKLQDELALQLARARGADVTGLRNEWAGLKGVSGDTILSAFREGVDGQTVKITDAVKTASLQGTAAGAEKGVQKGIEVSAAAPATNGAAASGSGGVNMQGLVGLLGAGLGGFSTGYQSANPGMGLLGGAVQGLGAGMQMTAVLGTIAPVIGAVVGGIAGLIGGLMGARAKLKAAKRELEKQMNAINNLLAVGEGRGIGVLQKQLSDYLGEIDKAVSLAWKAKNFDLVDRLHQSWNTMFLRLRRDFYDALPGQMEAYSSGYGTDSPLYQGSKAMRDLREELRTMLADVAYFSEETINKIDRASVSAEEAARLEAELREMADRDMAAATEAAKRMILAFIGGRQEFTEYESAVQAVQGAVKAAQTALEELGMSAYAAAEALDKQLNAALAKLRSAFLDDISASLYELSDLGYFNDLLDAQKRYNDRLRDSAALGLSADLANRELALSLRNIVKEAKLTDDQIRQLAAAMPELSGALMGLIGMGEGVDTAQALADAQAKVEDAKAALRSAYEKERSEIESTISRLKSFTEGIRSFRDSLRLDKQLSPLSPYERLAEAQRQFNEVSAKALAGDETAQGRLEEVSRAYLEEARGYYASSEAYFQIFEQVEATLDQALAKAEGQLSNAEKQLSALEKQVGKLIDIDDGVKSVSAAIADLKAAQAAEASAQAADDAYKNTVFQEMLAVLKAQLAAQNAAAVAQQQASTASTANYSSTDPVANLYRSILKREPDPVGYAFYSGNLNAGLTTLAGIEADLKKHAAGMASGGWVTGGVPGMDSVLKRLMPGEFVMPAAQAQRYRPEIEAMRGGWYAANDNSAVVKAIQAMQRQFADMMQRLIQIEAMSGRENVQATLEAAAALREQGRNAEFRSRQKKAA